MPSNAATMKERDTSSLLHQFPLKSLHRALHTVSLCFIPSSLTSKSYLTPYHLFLLNRFLIHRSFYHSYSPKRLHHTLNRFSITHPTPPPYSLLTPPFGSCFSTTHPTSRFYISPSPTSVHPSYAPIRLSCAGVITGHHSLPTIASAPIIARRVRLSREVRGWAALEPLGTAREVRLNRLGMRGCWAPRNGATPPNG